MGISQCTASLPLYLPFTHLSAETPWCHCHASCLHTSIFCRINKRGIPRGIPHARRYGRYAFPGTTGRRSCSQQEAAAGCNWLNRSPKTCTLLTHSSRRVVGSAPSSPTREKADIWSLLIPLNRGATEATAVKNARALEMHPHAGRQDPRRFNCSPITPPPPPGPDERRRGRKSPATVQHCTTQLTQFGFMLGSENH